MAPDHATIPIFPLTSVVLFPELRTPLHSGAGHLISLDRVIEVMKRTGDDMKREYKETSEGGLAAVSLPEC